MSKKTESKTQDVPNGKDVVGTGNDARLKMLEQINDANDKALADEGVLHDVNDDDTTSEFIPSNLTDEEIAQRELQRAEEESGAEVVVEEPAPQKVKIKVNGKEEELTMQELIERAQKSEGAEEKFREAARLRAEAEELRKKNLEPEPSSEDVAAKEREKRRERVRAIQMGTEDEALQAWEEMERNLTHNAPPLREDEVIQKVQSYLSFNEAVSRFKSEYKDIVEDPVLLDIVLERDKKLLAQGDPRNYWERYDELGKDVRKWMAEKTKTTTPPPAPDKNKQQRKASAPAVPQGASTKAPEAIADEETELSPSEVIAEMARKRGGAQFMR